MHDVFEQATDDKEGADHQQTAAHQLEIDVAALLLDGEHRVLLRRTDQHAVAAQCLALHADASQHPGGHDGEDIAQHRRRRQLRDVDVRRRSRDRRIGQRQR